MKTGVNPLALFISSPEKVGQRMISEGPFTQSGDFCRRMNIEEDFAVAAACLCIKSLILFPVFGEDEDIGERRFFLSVLAITIQKQHDILREKTSREVLVIQLCQKSSRYRTKSRRNRRVVYTCDFEVATSGRQKLH